MVLLVNLGGGWKRAGTAYEVYIGIAERRATFAARGQLPNLWGHFVIVD